MQKLKVLFRNINQITTPFGFNFKVFLKALKSSRIFFRNYIQIKRQLKNNNEFRIEKCYPCLLDRSDKGGEISGHYFHQDYLIAKRIFEKNPHKHVDIGSRIDGFVAHIATFRKVEVFDIRNLYSPIDNIVFKQLDITGDVSRYYNYTDSLSSLHVIEHIGLGRYGDNVDIKGHIHALDNIYKIIKKDGICYISTPIGPQRIEFNAHRVFAMEYLLNLFKDKFKLMSLSFVDDKGDIHINVDVSEKNVENNFGCKFGCGIFEMIKL